MKEHLTHERAEILALEALAWLAGQPDAVAKFLTISGLEASDLRRAVGDSGLQVSVLGDEKLLLNLCESASLKPQAVHLARYQLEGGVS